MLKKTLILTILSCISFAGFGQLKNNHPPVNIKFNLFSIWRDISLSTEVFLNDHVSLELRTGYVMRECKVSAGNNFGNTYTDLGRANGLKLEFNQKYYFAEYHKFNFYLTNQILYSNAVSIKENDVDIFWDGNIANNLQTHTETFGGRGGIGFQTRMENFILESYLSLGLRSYFYDASYEIVKQMDWQTGQETTLPTPIPGTFKDVEVLPSMSFGFLIGFDLSKN